jgi:mucin-2
MKSEKRILSLVTAVLCIVSMFTASQFVNAEEDDLSISAGSVVEEESESPATFYDELPVVTDPTESLTDATEATTSTSVHQDYVGIVSVVNLPDKTEYNIGEELDLTGLTVSFLSEKYKNVYVDVSPLDYPDAFEINKSNFDSSKAGKYYISIEDGTAVTGHTLGEQSDGFYVTVLPSATTLTTLVFPTEVTTTTSVNITQIPVTSISVTTPFYEPAYALYIVNKPDKTNYNIGEELDLTGLTVNVDYYNYFGKQNIYNNVSPLDYPKKIAIDTSEFDNTKVGTYTIKMKYIDWPCYDVPFEVTVSDGTTTTSAVSTTQTTTTDVTTTSTSTTPQVTITTINVLHDPTCGILLKNKPDKTDYTVGEELDLTGLTVSCFYDNNRGEYIYIYENVSPFDYPDDFIVDTSNFDNTKAGIYVIQICAKEKGQLSWFKYVCAAACAITVSEPEIYGDADKDGVLNVRDAAYIARMIAKEKQSELTLDADFNKDGVVNIRDAAAIARSLAVYNK